MREGNACHLRQVFRLRVACLRLPIGARCRPDSGCIGDKGLIQMISDPSRRRVRGGFSPPSLLSPRGIGPGADTADNAGYNRERLPMQVRLKN